MQALILGMFKPPEKLKMATSIKLGSEGFRLPPPFVFDKDTENANG
jgi:hypothetical protein